MRIKSPNPKRDTKHCKDHSHETTPSSEPENLSGFKSSEPGLMKSCPAALQEMLSDLVHSMGASNAHNDIKMVPETWCHNALDSTRWGDVHIELSHCRAQQVTWLCWEVRTLLHQGKCHSNMGNRAEGGLQGHPSSPLPSILGDWSYTGHKPL